MKWPSLTLFLCLALHSVAQTSLKNKDNVQKFKADFLVRKQMYVPDTMIIDRVTYTRERLPFVRRIEIFGKDRKDKNVEYYYNDSKILESNYYYDSTGWPKGITKHYNKRGELEYIQDYSNGTWEVIKLDNYPYYGLLKKMKQVADSIIISTYGMGFFEKNVVWLTDGSVYHGRDYKGATWNEPNDWEPKDFTLSYGIKIKDDFFDDNLWVSLDSNGKLIEGKGLQKTNTQNEFLIDRKQAITKAKELGLIENDSSKTFTFLKWECLIDEQGIRNCIYTYNVGIKTKTIQHEPRGGRSRIEYKFDVYVFDPWTSAFLKKKKMKSFHEWEKRSGSTSGLMDDK